MTSFVGIGVFNSLKRAPLIVKPLHLRCISTSKKNRDTAAIGSEASCEPVWKAKDKNWVSLGFSETSYEEDRHFAHMTMFLAVSVTFICGGFILAYRPDNLGRDWAQREGFLELRRREKLGLPLIDPNYLPLDKIKLPSDEELGDTEIVI